MRKIFKRCFSTEKCPATVRRLGNNTCELCCPELCLSCFSSISLLKRKCRVPESRQESSVLGGWLCGDPPIMHPHLTMSWDGYLLSTHLEKSSSILSAMRPVLSTEERMDKKTRKVCTLVGAYTGMAGAISINQYTMREERIIGGNCAWKDSVGR